MRWWVWASILRGQEFQHLLGWAAQARAQRGDHDGAVDQDGVGEHGIDELAAVAMVAEAIEQSREAS